MSELVVELMALRNDYPEGSWQRRAIQSGADAVIRAEDRRVERRRIRREEWDRIRAALCEAWIGDYECAKDEEHERLHPGCQCPCHLMPERP